ncbi:MAG: UvrD-helicase domain-containing protein [Bacteroidales bacterium]|nr:UvrD-helicase domain-containing protein [Bacteroidales bacterium]
MSRTGNLFVYDASAGSGKTHRLSRKFSDYLIAEYRKGNRDAYKYVMAVTFTNKATYEMKSRIIDRLLERSKDESDPDHNIAKDILQRLVHDYTMFKVSTIDSFFQKVLKAFALEMGSRSAFDTSLDTDSAVEAALDGVYSKLGSDRELLGTMEDLSLSRVEEGKNWNWRDDLIRISKEVLNPEYRHYRSLSAGENIRELGKRFERRIRELERCYVSKVIGLEEGLRANSDGIDSFKVNSRLKKFVKGELAKDKQYVDKLQKRILSRPDIPDQWSSDPDSFLLVKGTKADIDSVNRITGGRLQEMVALNDAYYTEYLTITKVVAYIRETALLEHVSKEMDDYLQSQQLTLLAEAPQILADLISGSDTPFVFDKIGTAIDHYLLDEFQDTSVDQWRNFKPLVGEGISRGFQSLLVGDVKQSIYRWRGGDWNLLKDTVPAEFREDYEKEFLKVNYRSLRNIVLFNNLAFSDPGFLVKGFMANLDEKTGNPALSAQIGAIYSSPAQTVRKEYAESSQSGVVHIISCAGNGKDSVLDNNGFILWDVARRIRFLVSEKGYAHQDIAILTSTKNEASLVANYLVNRNIPIVSGESLKLDSNKTVSVLIEILKKLTDSGSRGLDLMLRISGVRLKNLEMLDSSNEGSELFLGRLKACNTLYQICKMILKEFFYRIEESDMSFVNAFMDKVLDYSSLYGTSIADFLKWWSLSADNFFIPEPLNSHAVKIMTMHKAKGLDFKAVFIPFLRDRMIDFKNGNKWFRTDSDIVGYKGPLLLSLNAGLEDTVYENDLNRERMEVSVDNLNLAYVSFTRPKERLYIYAKMGGNYASTVSGTLNRFCEDNSSGEHPLFVRSEHILDSRVILAEDPGLKLDESLQDFKFVDFSLGDDSEVPYEAGSAVGNGIDAGNLAMSLMNESSKTKLKGEFDRDDNVQRGLLWHQLFSMIEDEGKGDSWLEETVRKAVDRFARKNPGSLPECDAEKVLGMIEGVASYGWFGSGNCVLNEVSILDRSDIWRPDRVILPADGSMEWAQVVDYKFGSFEENSPKHLSYERQVRNYMRLLKGMGYSGIKGYLWYVLEGKVIEVYA